MRPFFLSVVAVMLPIQAMAQSDTHVLDRAFNDAFSYQVYCDVPVDHASVACSITVSTGMFRPQFAVTSGYRLRDGRSVALKMSASFLGYRSESTPVNLGDTLVLQWDGGRLPVQIGKGWTKDQWAGYVQRLTDVCDWERSPAGILAFQQQLGIDLGFPLGGIVPLPVSPLVGAGLAGLPQMSTPSPNSSAASPLSRQLCQSCQSSRALACNKTGQPNLGLTDSFWAVQCAQSCSQYCGY